MQYSVINKITGDVVYNYTSTDPIEWSGYEFETHNHFGTPDEPSQQPNIIPKIWTKTEFKRRFTQQERIAIRNAASVSPELSDYLDILNGSEEVKSDDQDTIDSLNMLEQVGLIAAGRALEILNGN
jgi:hypothetical protein